MDSISAFASLVSIPIGIMSSVVGWNIFLTGTAIKMYKPIIKKKEGKKCNKIVLLAKTMSKIP